MYSITGPSNPADIALVFDEAGAELADLTSAAVEEAREILAWRAENDG